jgi:hypothetical protein
MAFFQKNKKLISVIIIFIIIALAIVLPVYFLVIKKTNSSQSPSNEQSMEPSTIPKMGPNELGFCFASTTGGIKGPNRFSSLESFTYLNTRTLQLADAGGTETNGIQFKWFYDKTNPLNITRTILNENKTYTNDELANLGQTSTPTSYLVNQIIPIYDKTNPIYSKATVELDPFILTTYSQCM